MIPRFNWATGNGDWQPEGKVVEANAFILLDDQGIRRGMMFVREGTASLNLLDAAGKHRAGLNVAADGGAAICVNDSNGCPQALLGLQATGDPFLALVDTKGRPRACVTISNNSVWLIPVDEHGKPAVGLELVGDGTAKLHPSGDSPSPS